MAAAKLFLLSCLVAVVGYFTYKELQVSTLFLVKEIHIPAKQSDVFQKLFDDPEFYPKIHPLWYVFFSTLFHNREVSFDIFRVLVPSGFQKPRCRCEFDRKTKFQWPEFEMRGNLLSGFFNAKTVGFNYCLIDSLNFFTLRCIAALVLVTLSDSKTMKDEELFSLISTGRQYCLDSMTLVT